MTVPDEEIRSQEPPATFPFSAVADSARCRTATATPFATPDGSRQFRQPLPTYLVPYSTNKVLATNANAGAIARARIRVRQRDGGVNVSAFKQTASVHNVK